MIRVVMIDLLGFIKKKELISCCCDLEVISFVEYYGGVLTLHDLSNLTDNGSINIITSDSLKLSVSRI